MNFPLDGIETIHRAPRGWGLSFFGLPSFDEIESEAVVPKMKTHKGSRKRFKVTAKGKLKRHQAGKSHLMSHKTGKRKRHLSQPVVDDRKLAKKYVEVLGGE